MSIEEHFLEAIDLERKNKLAIGRFLGRRKLVHAVGIAPRYYGELLAWALKCFMEKEKWQIIHTLGYHGREPVYIDVNTDYDQRENMLMDGQFLAKKGEDRVIVTVDINMRWRNSILVEGPAQKKEQIDSFIADLMTLVKDQNFYRGKKIEFGGRLRFLDLRNRSWESIILDEVTKEEIKSNTIGFLSRKEIWVEYNIPLRRGVLLAGEPGTGKTIICKALMSEAQGITCITTSAYTLDADEYLAELYELAEDLSPCLIFIEDIDLIGQNREEFGYQRGSALLSLLSILDGVEEKKEIVTVATTNCLETLDKALSRRPSRFDRVIKLSLPSLEERKELIGLLCQKIPVDKMTQDYIAQKAEHCTPAQLQEIVFSLVIQNSDELSGSRSTYLEVSKDGIDTIVSKVNGRNRHHIGFYIRDNHNGENLDLIGSRRL
ncbi:AAA family ATPase [Chloroflexota bacterium]